MKRSVWAHACPLFLDPNAHFYLKFPLPVFTLLVARHLARRGARLNAEEARTLKQYDNAGMWPDAYDWDVLCACTCSHVYSLIGIWYWMPAAYFSLSLVNLIKVERFWWLNWIHPEICVHAPFNYLCCKCCLRTFCSYTFTHCVLTVFALLVLASWARHRLRTFGHYVYTQWHPPCVAWLQSKALPEPILTLCVCHLACTCCLLPEQEADILQAAQACIK